MDVVDGGAPKRAESQWQLFRRANRNIFITVILITIFLDGCPYTSKPIRNRIDYFLDVTGLWQGAWSMFTPEPDHENHRLKIVFTLADKGESTWHSPEWSKLSPSARFASSRWTEYIDNIPGENYSAAWPAMLDYYVTRYRKKHPDRIVEHASLHMRTASIKSPWDTGWLPRATPQKWGDWRQLHIKYYLVEAEKK